MHYIGLQTMATKQIANRRQTVVSIFTSNIVKHHITIVHIFKDLLFTVRAEVPAIPYHVDHCFSNLKVTGTPVLARTATPFFLPGTHRGIAMTAATA